MYLSVTSSNDKRYKTCIKSDCSTSIVTYAYPHTCISNSNIALLNSKRKRENKADIFETLSHSSTYSTRNVQGMENANDISFEEPSSTGQKEEEQLNLLKNGLLGAGFSTFRIFDKNKKVF